jgi:AP2 domain
MKSKDLTGQRFSRLVVEGFDQIHIQPSGQTSPRWLCKCDCGVIKSVLQKSLKSGNTKSCGCLSKEKATKSGMSRTKQYKIWHNMKSRCNNPKDTSFAFYGAKGIDYDPKWKTFEGFWEDMEEGYNDTLTLDRINSKSNYCKDNCQWTTPAKQTRNRGKQSNNTSGKNGVVLRTEEGKPAYWRAQWYAISGGLKFKSFSIRKYGDQEAFRLACEYRDKQIESLNDQGAGYTEGHGI